MYAYISLQTPIFTFTFIERQPYPREAFPFSVYIPGASWTTQHFTDTLAFKDHWQHHLHDLAGGRLTFITIYKLFSEREG